VSTPSDLPLFPSVGVPTFLRAPLVADLDFAGADVVVLGVPTDEGSPYKPGSRFAPRALREHSLRFCAGGAGFFDPHAGRTYLDEQLRGGRLVDAGDAPILPTNVEATFDGVTAIVAAIRRTGALPVVLGGDHAVPYPVVRAYEEDLHVIQFDAHLDYEPFAHGLSLTNGHAFRHIARMGHVQSLTQIGIRSIRNPRETFEESIADGNTVVTMASFEKDGIAAALAAVPTGAKAYVSVDIDVLDMSLIPGCMSAEPDGMTYAQLRQALAVVAERTHVVGFDLCEINPLLDVGTGVTAYLGTYLVLEFLGQICSQPGFADARR
jgi:agmatinase